MAKEFNQAEGYEKNSADQRTIGLDLTRTLTPERGSTILDLGCGTGFLTKTLADLVGPEGSVVGVDPDQERLNIAQEKYSASNLVYLKGSAECIPGDDFMYDFVFSNAVLHWCKDKDGILKQVRLKLKQGGKFGFVCLSQDIIKDYIPIASTKLVAAIAAKFHRLEWDKFSLIATQNQFEILEKRCFTLTVKHKGTSDLARFVTIHIGEEFDESHFNADAVRDCYGEGEISRQVEITSAILRKK